MNSPNSLIQERNTPADRENISIKGVLLDKDGTLIEIEHFWFTLTDFVARLVISENTPHFSLQLYDEMMELAGFDKNGRLIPESPVVAGTNQDIAALWEKCFHDNNVKTDKNFVSYIVSCISKYCTKGEVKATTPNLREIIIKLKNKGYKIGIATSDDYKPTEYCLQRLGISDLVDDIFSADRVQNPKPSSDTMNLACSTWGLIPDEIIMIGDSVNDMKFALNAGCRGIYLSKDKFLPKGASKVIKSLDELDI